MPRTRQARKRNSNNSDIEESDLLVTDFDRQMDLKIRKIEAEYENLYRGLLNKIDVSLSMMPDVIRKNVRLCDCENLKLALSDVNDEKNVTSTSDDHTNTHIIPPLTSKNKISTKRQTAVSTDDGYVTESSGQKNNCQRVSRIDNAKTTSKRTGKQRSISQDARENIRTRSSSSSGRGRSNTRINSKFVTPAVSRHATEYNLVTPKIKPNTPLNIMRRPRQGEIALSMQGSPLLVSAIIPDRTANVNVPLNNGNIISLLPNAGLKVSDVPELDKETKRQLATLAGHIGKLIDKQ